MSRNVFGVKTAKTDRQGDLYKIEDVAMACVNCIDVTVQKGDKRMAKVIKEASNAVDEATKRYARAFDGMTRERDRLDECTKKAAQSIKKSVNSVGSSVENLHNKIDFDKFERFTKTLESAALALKTISELEKDGKLEGIAKALKA